MEIENFNLDKIYTHCPKQHSNLILGSLQLLFWLVFRPIAWKNYLWRSNLPSNSHFRLTYIFTQQRWRRWQSWQLIIQGFILLPILINIPAKVIALILGAPLEPIMMASNVLLAIVSGLITGIFLNATFGILICVSSSVVANISNGLLIGSMFGLAIGIGRGILLNSSLSNPIVLLLSVLLGIAFGIVESIIGGIVLGIGTYVNWWRPIAMSFVCTPWHVFLYYADRAKIVGRYSLLHKHIAFWDEWQYLPVLGLDNHLLLVLEHNPSEGQAALNYLATTHQRWAAVAAKIELDARQLDRCNTPNDIAKIHQTNGEV